MLTVPPERGLEATEDIVASNGMKLLPKGSRIDATMRERLLEHKLQRPLEDCLAITDGVQAALLVETAERLLEQHPLLRAVCGDGRSPAPPAVLGALRLSAQAQALLTLYGEQKPGRLDHAVGVTLLALALGRRLLPGEPAMHDSLVLAGLLHDVGELYIDTTYFDSRQPLGPAQWRQIASHPVVGHRVLRGLPGAGGVVATAVRDHHERLDGFGYPRGAREPALPLPGQVLAVAEWLMAMIESGLAPASRVCVTTKLIQGEFGTPLVELLTSLAAPLDETVIGLTDSRTNVEGATERLRQLAQTLRRFEAEQADIATQVRSGGSGLRQVVEGALQRLTSIQVAFTRTGLDGQLPEPLLQDLAMAGDPALWLETSAILHELSWRLREVERTLLLRAGLLNAADQQRVQAVIGRLFGQPDRASA